MTREIKFRGKSLKTGEWVHGDLIENQGRYFIYHASSETTLQDNDVNIVVIAEAVDNNTIGPYALRKDKNGREIYENDIIKDSFGTLYEVVFSETLGAFMLDEIPTTGNMVFLGYYDEEHLEVIGNIFDSKFSEYD